VDGTVARSGSSVRSTANRGGDDTARDAFRGVRRGDEATSQSAGKAELEAETMAALRQPSATDKYSSLMAIFKKLSPGNWRGVLEAFDQERKLTGLAHPEAFELFIRRAGEVAGKDVVGFFLSSNNMRDANSAMMGWASKSPEDALSWLGQQTSADARQKMLGGAIRGLALSEPDLAVKTLEGVPVQDRNKYTQEFVTSMVRSAGIEGAQALVETMVGHATKNGELNADYIKSVFSDYALLRLQQASATGQVASAVNWLDQYIGQPYLDKSVITSATASLARQNPQETFRWLEAVNTTMAKTGAQDSVGYRVLLDTWANKEGQPVVSSWLQTQTANPQYDQLAYQYTAILAHQGSASATQWANSIQNSATRQNALDLVAKVSATGKKGR
jgi:hypothetical protein